ncbi:hypothetical protein Lal_00001015 [Lupinus albus]|nr:hypothetical protein Lal_00001015 [Lupinus albus]
MHEELKKLAKKYLDKKRLILEHEKKISELQYFIDGLKLENETLDLIYDNSSCNCTTKLSETPICENCKVLNAENPILKNKIAKFAYSSHNLDNLLATSRNVGVPKDICTSNNTCKEDVLAISKRGEERCIAIKDEKDKIQELEERLKKI